MEKVIAYFEGPQEFLQWLVLNHTQTSGIWLKISKKGSDISSVTYTEALDCALCYGWIDGQKDKFDEKAYLQYFCKRKKNSVWSQINQKKVAELISSGRMQAPGLAAIEEAKANGRWETAYQAISSREIPAELEAALNQNAKAKEVFDRLSSANRFAFIFRIMTAKKAETRLKKAAEFIRMLEHGEVFHPAKK